MQFSDFFSHFLVIILLFYIYKNLCNERDQGRKKGQIY